MRVNQHLSETKNLQNSRKRSDRIVGEEQCAMVLIPEGRIMAAYAVTAVEMQRLEDGPISELYSVDAILASTRFCVGHPRPCMS